MTADADLEWDADADLDDDDGPDDWDEHDQQHRWYHAGCTDCDLRADWIEAGRP